MNDLLGPLLRVAIRNASSWRLLKLCIKFLHQEHRPLHKLLETLICETEAEEPLLCLCGLFCRGGHAAEVRAIAEQSRGVVKTAAESALSDSTGQLNASSAGLPTLFALVPPAGDPVFAEPISQSEVAIAHLLCGNQGEIGVDLLIDLLEHPDNLISHLAKAALHQRGLAVADALVTRTAGLPHASKILAVEMLTNLGDSRVVDLVLDEFAKSDYNITNAGIVALAKLGGDRGFKVLLDLATSNIGAPGIKAAQALRRFGDAGSNALIATFRESATFRRSSGRLVAEIAGEQALPALLEALDDPLRAVRDSAEKGLAELGSVATNELIKRLTKGNAQSDVRVRAIRLLARAGAVESISLIASIATQGVGIERLSAVEALGALWTEDVAPLVFAVACSSDARLRAAGVRALGRARGLAGQEAIEILINAASDEDPAVFEAGLRGLRALGRANASISTTVVQPALRRLRPASAERKALIARVLSDLENPTVNLGREDGFFASAAASDASKSTRDGFELGSFDPLERWIKGSTSPHDHGWVQQPPPEPKNELGSEVHFSVTAPERVAPRQTFMLDIWAHAERELLSIQHAPRFDLQRIRQIVRTVGPALVARGVRLTVDLSIPRLGITDTNWLYWGGAPANCNFAVTVPADLTPGTYAGVIRIKIETMSVANVSFFIDVGQRPTDKVTDVTGQEQRLLRWFASYASADRDEVLGRIQGMLKVLPDLDVFVDVVSLRSGDDWESRITEEIRERDGLYLFWSPAAMRSNHVDREWRTALAVKGIDCIDPVPLAPPAVAPPPPELASLHFNEWTLAFRQPV